METKKVRFPIANIFFIPYIMVQLLFLESYGYMMGDITSWLEIAANIFLCVRLFTKKRDNILVIAVGCSVIPKVIRVLVLFNIYYFLDLASSIILFVFALALCEQTFVKGDLTNLKKIAKMLFFLPAILALLAFAPVVFGRYYMLLDKVRYLLYCVFLLTFAMWLKNPFAKQTTQLSAKNSNINYNSEEQEEAYCGLGKHILLCLFTFGVWTYIWIYRTTKYLNKAPNATYYNPTHELLLCMFVPFYSIFWYYKHGQRIDSLSRVKGLNNSDMATLCLILGIFVPIVACIIMQDRINALCTTKEAPAKQESTTSTADELKKYKDLLDNGIITQEEFDAKKKQLLSL